MVQKLETMIKRLQIPAVSTARIDQSGKMISQALGVSNVESMSAVTKDTVFEAASLSKPVFAYIVLKMIEVGHFSRPNMPQENGLDRPLHEICPFGPAHLREHPNYKLLTPRLILSHQSGLPNWFKSNQPEEYIAPSGTRFDYSGLGFCFLSEVVEFLKKTSLEELAQETFHSLEMCHSTFIMPDDTVDRAIGHHANAQVDTRDHFPLHLQPNPAASLFTTAEDYAVFLKACANDPFIREYMFSSQIALAGHDASTIMTSVSCRILQKLSWGLGIGLIKASNSTIIAFHWGDVETNRAFAAINLQTNTIITCFTNSTNGPLLYRNIIAPIVGDITPALQWIEQRERVRRT